MEHHGENPQNNVIAIIPARYASTRLPGKMLLPIAGKPLILHTVERVKAAKSVSRVIVATDDERIFNAVVESGSEAVMTSPGHNSGSDRVAEVARELPAGSVIVNVQGDEPMISPDTIDRAVETFLQKRSDMATASGPLNGLSELLNFNIVKIALGEHGNALYFSRSPMPFPREAAQRYDGDPNAAIRNEPELCSIFRRHIGIYVYSREYLLEFTRMPQTRLEKIEMLEQLRALENGSTIAVAEVDEVSPGVDTREDLDIVRLKVEFPEITFRMGRVEDIPAISQAYLDSVRYSFADILPIEYFQDLSVERRNAVFAARAQNESYRLLLAENGSKRVVGFIDYAQPVDDNFGYDTRVFSFYIRPELQRRGLGELLFRRCVSRMRDECYRSMCLDAFEANPYRVFYEKMDGKVVAHGKHEFGDKTYPTVVYGWDDISNI